MFVSAVINGKKKIHVNITKDFYMVKNNNSVMQSQLPKPINT